MVTCTKQRSQKSGRAQETQHSEKSDHVRLSVDMDVRHAAEACDGTARPTTDGPTNATTTTFPTCTGSAADAKRMVAGTNTTPRFPASVGLPRHTDYHLKHHSQQLGRQLQFQTLNQLDQDMHTFRNIQDKQPHPQLDVWAPIHATHDLQPERIPPRMPLELMLRHILIHQNRLPDDHHDQHKLRVEVVTLHLDTVTLVTVMHSSQTGPGSTCRSASRTSGPTTLEWSRRSCASYTYDGGMPANQRCGIYCRRQASTRFV